MAGSASKGRGSRSGSSRRSRSRTSASKQGHRSRSPYEIALGRQIELLGLEAPIPEFRFAPPRMFRFDFAWPEHKIGAEVDGGRFMVRRGRDGKPVPVGRHMTEGDYEKLNAAAAGGWRVFRFTPKMVQSGAALKMLEEVVPMR